MTTELQILNSQFQFPISKRGREVGGGRETEREHLNVAFYICVLSYFEIMLLIYQTENSNDLFLLSVS